MRRRLIGATLTIVGALILLFGPVRPTGYCPTDVECSNNKFSATSWWGLINYPPRWDRLFFPMFIIGVTLVVTGIVVMVKRSRSGRSPLVG